MNNLKTFELYAKENNLSDKTIVLFDKLDKEISYQEEKKTLTFSFLNLHVKNFGPIKDEFFDFEKDSSIKLIAPPMYGKTARIEAFIYAIFGQNKTLKDISEEITSTKVNIKNGKNIYTIERTVKNGKQDCEIYINNTKKDFASLKLIINYIEKTILNNITYFDFIDMMYSGDLSLKLTFKNQIDIKQLFINFVSQEWVLLHNAALAKIREIENNISKLVGVEETVRRISNNYSVKELTEELNTIKKVLPGLKKEIKETTIDNKSFLLLEKLDKEAIKYSPKINKQEIKEEINALTLLEKKAKSKEIIALSELIKKLENEENDIINKLNIIEITGKTNKNNLSKMKNGTCPILNTNCNIINDKIDDYTKELEKLRNEFVSITKEKELITNNKNKKIKEYNLIFNISSFLDIKTIEKNINDRKNILIEKIKTEEENEKKYNEIQSEKNTVFKKIEQDKIIKDKNDTLTSQMLEMTSRQTTINNLLNEITTIKDKINEKNKLDKELIYYKEILDATQRNNIPRIEALIYKKKVESKIKEFCKDLLPFTKYEFDENFVLLVDERDISLLNSASKKIIDIAFRLARLNIIANGKPFPLFMVDDIGDSLPDNQTNTLIEKIKEQKINIFIYSSNRKGVK